MEKLLQDQEYKSATQRSLTGATKGDNPKKTS
jgi:hypothetical protein